MEPWYPKAPGLSDKLADWETLALAGGDQIIIDRCVLDVGPLWAVDAHLFATKAKSYTCLDSAEGVLEHTKRIAPWVVTVQCDAAKPWPIDTETFDLVLDFSTFDDTGGPLNCYAEAYRVLRPGGTLVTTYANDAVITIKTDWIAQHPDQLAEYLRGLGFEIFRRLREDQARAAMIARKPLAKE